MVMSEEQKALMRERMEAVRNAKKSKKEAVAAAPIVDAGSTKPKILPQAKRVPKPIADEVLDAVRGTAPSAPKLKPLSQEPEDAGEIADAHDMTPTPRVAKIPQARFLSSIAAEPKKEKFAKLVFYKEPNAKQQSKLTKILQEEQSSDEEKPVIVSKVAPEPASSTESYQQQHEQKIKRMQAMASKFF
jgi:hypothetical protein